MCGCLAGIACPPLPRFSETVPSIRITESLREKDFDVGCAARVGPRNPKLTQRFKRRRFTAEYKLGILQQVGVCSQPGEIGALLRREGLYTSHIAARQK